MGTVAYAKKRSIDNSDSPSSSSGDKSSRSAETGGSNTETGDTNAGSDENKDTSTQIPSDDNNNLNTGEPTTPQQGKCPQAPTGVVDCSKTPSDPSCIPTPTL
jgi:hypothetical protein